MPRPTKLAIQLGGALDLPAGRVQGWIEDGYGPAGDADPVEHYRRLAPLLGTGRDGDVAVLKMAADGYPCRRLRDVLTRLTHPDDDGTGDADELVERFANDPMFGDLRRIVTDDARHPPADWQGLPEAVAPETDAIDITTRAAVVPIADMLTGSPVEPFDSAELDRLVGVAERRLGLTPARLDDEKAEVNLAAFDQARAAVSTSNGWLGAALPAELAGGVKAAKTLVDALAVMYPTVGAWGEEHRWRRIGLLAPVAAPVLAHLHEVIGSAQELGALPDFLQPFLHASLDQSTHVPTPESLESPPRDA